MKKEEIKKDYIYDRIMTFINYANTNKKQFWVTITFIFGALVVFVLYSNSIDKTKLSNNAYISSHQNNFIDNKKDLAFIGFKNILDDFPMSETFNQAFIYMLSDAADNNNSDQIGLLLDKYQDKFDTEDSFLNSMLYKLVGDYYLSIDDKANTILYYTKAIDEVENDDYLNKYKLSLISIYMNHLNTDDAKDIFDSISKDDLSYENKNKYNEIESKLIYQSK